MKRQVLEVYSDVPNLAVVRPPGRQLPGSVIQSDSLSIPCSLAHSIHQNAIGTKNQELIDDSTELLELLVERQRHYERVLGEHGIELPYSKSL